MQRNYVMALDVAFPAVAVDLLEVKPACRAGERFTAPPHAFDLAATQTGLLTGVNKMILRLRSPTTPAN
jgi:hypothetical protein